MRSAWLATRRWRSDEVVDRGLQGLGETQPQRVAGVSGHDRGVCGAWMPEHAATQDRSWARASASTLVSRVIR